MTATVHQVGFVGKGDENVAAAPTATDSCLLYLRLVPIDELRHSRLRCSQLQHDASRGAHVHDSV